MRANSDREPSHYLYRSTEAQCHWRKARIHWNIVCRTAYQLEFWYWRQRSPLMIPMAKGRCSRLLGTWRAAITATLLWNALLSKLVPSVRRSRGWNLAKLDNNGRSLRLKRKGVEGHVHNCRILERLKLWVKQYVLWQAKTKRPDLKSLHQSPKPSISLLNSNELHLCRYTTYSVPCPRVS